MDVFGVGTFSSMVVAHQKARFASWESRASPEEAPESSPEGPLRGERRFGHRLCDADDVWAPAGTLTWSVFSFDVLHFGLRAVRATWMGS